MKAIGFDLGETLICYEDVPLSWHTLYRPALQQMANACGCLVDDRLLQVGGEILARYNTRLVPRLKEITGEQVIGEILAAWGCPGPLAAAEETFFAYFQRHASPYPETLETLISLKESGFRIGVLTDVPYGMSKAFVQQDLQSTGIHRYIDVLVTSVDVGWRKPSTEGFLCLAERLNAPPASMVYVGNECKDVTGANAAGILSVLVDRAGDAAGCGESVRIHALSELNAVLARHCRAG